MSATVVTWTRHLFVPAAARATAAPAGQTLAHGQALRVMRPLGRSVRCERGSLWLTFDGDPRDVVLAAGQTHRCDRDTRLVIYALDDARVALTGP